MSFFSSKKEPDLRAGASENDILKNRGWDEASPPRSALLLTFPWPFPEFSFAVSMPFLRQCSPPVYSRPTGDIVWAHEDVKSLLGSIAEVVVRGIALVSGLSASYFSWCR